MNKFAFVFACLLLQIPLFAQTPTPTLAPSPTPPVVDDDDVVVINTNLIQVDAIVTDKNGKQVPDLKPEDFEIYENGVKQKITNLSYVSVAPEAAQKPAAEAAPKTVDKLAPPVPVRLKPEQVRRTIALVVDDLGLSFESTAFVRQALKKFVDEQIQPNDLIAIVRTGGGIGALQSFTSDKRQLLAAIEKVRFNSLGRAGVGAFAPIEATPAERLANQSGSDDDAERAKRDRQSQIEFETFRTQIFSVGTLGALNFIVKGMSELPGRKAVVLLSDGFSLMPRDADGNLDTQQSQLLLEALRRLTDDANRAAIVVNTVDARGLQTLGLTAADSTDGLTQQQVQQRVADRANALFDTQAGLNYLAQETGGRAFRNNNDIKGAIEKVLDDQRGYYLLGYEPDAATFDPAKRRFNKLTVKVVRAGLTVRYRSGFFGVTDAARSTAANKSAPTAQQRLFGALTSPFGASAINLRLNALFGNDAKNGSFIRSLVHIEAKDLTFADDAENTKKAVFDVVAYTFGDNGAPVDQINKTYTLRVKNDENFRRLLDKGLVYQINVPVKKPGAYQLRIALRDAASDKLGAANQFVEVPNVKKDRLTLSGIVLQSLPMQQYEKLLRGESLDSTAQNAETAIDAQTDTALRRFKRDTILQYGLSVYNAKLDNARRPQLTVQTRIFRDGKLFFEGKPILLDATNQTDSTRINYNSAISLPPQMPVGDYVLQLVVADQLAKEKRRVAAQFVEFELVNQSSQ